MADVDASIRSALRAISIGSYLLQSRIAAERALHPTDLQAIHVLGRSGGATAGALAEALGVTSGGATAVVDRLVRGGYVARTRDPSDRRRVLLTLVPGEALEALRDGYAEIDERLDALLGARSAEDKAVVAAFLEALADGGPPDRPGTFRAPLFRVPGKGGWTFVEVPGALAPDRSGPWGRVPVQATVDGVTWETSVWKEASGRVLLAVPARVRRGKGHDDEVEVTVEPR